MASKISLKDIAGRVGVSIAMVSYVLNGKRKGRVSVEVEQKIRDVAKQLNYTPNFFARGLKTKKSFTIGLLVADIANPFSAALARIIEDEASQVKYTVFIGSSDERPAHFEKLINLFFEKQVDGFIILAPAGAEPILNNLLQRHTPFVLLDRVFTNVNAPSIILNNFEMSYQATLHLLQQGRRNVLMIGYDSELEHLKDRHRGYVAALTECSDPAYEPDIFLVDRSTQHLQTVTGLKNKILGENKPDAIIFMANTLAIIGLKFIQTLPLKIPEDLCLVTYDQNEAFDFFYAPLTYIKQPLKQFGMLAVKELMAQIEDPTQVNHHVVAGELVIRASSDLAAL